MRVKMYLLFESSIVVEIFGKFPPEMNSQQYGIVSSGECPVNVP